MYTHLEGEVTLVSSTKLLYKTWVKVVMEPVGHVALTLPPVDFMHQIVQLLASHIFHVEPFLRLEISSMAPTKRTVLSVTTHVVHFYYTTCKEI